MIETDEIPYVQWNKDDWPRPCVPVDLPDGSREWALVDSGADVSSWPRRLMEPLGIDAADCIRSERVINGQGDWHEDVVPGGILTHVCGYPVRLYASFGDNLWDRIILGRLDVFRAFDFSFDECRLKLRLTPHADTARGELTGPDWWIAKQEAARGEQILCDFPLEDQ